MAKTREEVKELFDEFAERLEDEGFEVSHGSTGGVDLEVYASVEAEDAKYMDWRIDVSTNAIRHDA